MEDALNGSSISDDHRAIMGMVLKNLWSAETGMRVAFNGLLSGFEVSQVILLSLIFCIYYETYAILIAL
jgi:hypothetical protein